MTLHNDTFLRALMREHTDFTPVWLMRQAGRYLPEYCATRSKAGSFMGLAKNPDYATEVTLQPIDRYGIDAAILFSDILTVPDAMGLGLSFVQEKALSLRIRFRMRQQLKRWLFLILKTNWVTLQQLFVAFVEHLTIACR